MSLIAEGSGLAGLRMASKAQAIIKNETKQHRKAIDVF